MIQKRTFQWKGIAFLFTLLIPILSWAQYPELLNYLNYPIHAGLVSSGDNLVWSTNEEGKRNLYITNGSNSEVRRLTNYSKDDGQELKNISISSDGKWVVYSRGGNHGGNWSAASTTNPESLISSPELNVWSVSTSGGKPVLLGRGSYPKISPKGDEVIFMRSGTAYISPIDGSKKSRVLFQTRGTVRHVAWSPSGTKLAFSVSRSSHAFIGVYTKGKSHIDWVSPGLDKDEYPVWSPDETKIAFIRTPGESTELEAILPRKHNPWEIRVTDLASGKSEAIYIAPRTLAGSAPTTAGRYNLHWTHKGIIYLSNEDGWPHLYSIQPNGKNKIQLTKGSFMVEEVHVSDHHRHILFSANTGELSDDIDRRHIGIVSTHVADMRMLTKGKGIENFPVMLGDDRFAFLSSTYNRPALPALSQISNPNNITLLGEEFIPESMAIKDFVEPQQVVFQSVDGLTVHGQLYEKKDGKKNKPAIVFVHGGPQRQILLAWDQSGYYSHTYAMNQYLANKGFVVLSVNYRLGIGYGYDFHKPEASHRFGASEYNDVLAAGLWLKAQPQVNENKVGIYGGSYGGYLTAMALGRNSDIFAAGVDIHGVHTRVPSSPHTSIYEKAPDAAQADSVAWASSPIAFVDGWTSPVLLIHGDDDRNVGFSHSVDLYQRLKKRGVQVEYLVFPDETHHWMLYRNLLKLSSATVKFLSDNLMN